MKRGCLTRFRHPFFHSYRYSGIFPTRNFRRVEKICQTDLFPFFEASRTAFPYLSDRASIRAAVTGSSAGNPPPACTSKARAVNSGGLCVGKAEPFPQPLRRPEAESRSGRRHDHPDGCTIIRCAQPSGPRFRYDRPGPRVRIGRAGAVGLTRLIARRPAPAVEAGMFRVVGTIHRPAVGPPSVRHSLPSCCTNSVRVGKANSRPASPKDSRIAMFISDIAFRISPCFSM